MRNRRSTTTMSLLVALLASWLSLTCAHCWAHAAPAEAAHCEHASGDGTAPDCCDHDQAGEVCPEAELDAVPIAKSSDAAPPHTADQPALLPAESRPWMPWRSPPPRITQRPRAPLPADPLYLRHCAFLK